MDLSGASALVTGGASGLGFATAKRLADAGAHVVIVDLPSSPGVERAAELGGAFAAADVTDPGQVAAAVAAASAAGPLRVVVNCAGIAPPAKVLDRDGVPTDIAHFEKIVRVNLIGTYNVIGQASAAIARTQPTDGGDRGVIVNTASSYRSFLTKFPDSDLTATARKLEQRLRNRPEIAPVVAGAGAARSRSRSSGGRAGRPSRVYRAMVPLMTPPILAACASSSAMRCSVAESWRRTRKWVPATRWVRVPRGVPAV